MALAFTDLARMERREWRLRELEVGRPQERQRPGLSLPNRLSQLEGRPMQVNLHDAKTHLSRYVDQALAGEEVVIARAGKPLVRLMPVAADPPPRRLGFLAGTARVEADLKRDFASEINSLFQLAGDQPPEQP